MSENSVCFVIANKYYRNYPSHLNHYVNNIIKFYKNSFVLIVDNNSKYISDFKFEYDNVVLLDNTSECKFELGAYKFGIKYLIENNMISKYNYYVFAQDTFVLNNFFDFNKLIENNTTAAPLISGRIGFDANSHYNVPFINDVIKKINLIDDIPNFTYCLSNSFVLHNSKLEEFLDITKDLIITVKLKSQYCEPLLSGILYHLNNMVNTYIDRPNLEDKGYHEGNVNVENNNLPNYFIKRVYDKNEKIVDV